jgi:phosphatidylinositol alpha-1,6-mannosyltransferase
VANSTWTADLARGVYELLGRHDLAARVQVVPLGTDPRQFAPGIDTRAVRAKHGLEGGPWLLTVARLEWHKGIDTVIRALPAVREIHPGVRYAVAGTGPRGDELARIAGQSGVRHAVKFLGFVPDEELPALYNAADLYVGVSRQHDLLVEGFGISLVEAQASGLPVVAGRSGGVADAVRDRETGILVDPGSPTAVAETVNQLLRDEAKRRQMGAAGRRAVETYYNWDRVARDFMRIDEQFRR